MVVPVVNSRKPDSPWPCQYRIRSTASDASASSEKTPANRSGCTRTASTT
jgi:hypothetical protein